jgi:hypothetical protein
MSRLGIASLIAFIGLSRASVAMAAPASFQGAVAASSPVLYYQLNEAAGNAHNFGSLGAAFDATYQGTPTRAVQTASGDTGVAFHGVGDYLESSSASPVSLTGNPTFTAEAVVFMPSAGSAQLWAPLLHWGTGGGTGAEVYFSFSNNDDTRYFAGFYNGGLRTTGAQALDTWHHVVWVRNGGGTDQAGSTLYVDGAVVATQADPALCCNGTTPNVTSSPFRINRASDFTRFFTGTLDEVVLYDRALSASEVQAHFRALSPSSAPAAPPWILVVLAAGLAAAGYRLVRSRPSGHTAP